MDQPFVNGEGPDPLDTTLFKTTDAPPCPNKVDINAHLYALFPPDFVKDYPDAWVEIAFADMAGNGKPDGMGKHPASQTADRATQTSWQACISGLISKSRGTTRGLMPA
jgi:hypothetical protein